MRGRFIPLLLALTVLFGSAVSPAIAHEQGDAAVHVSDILDIRAADAPTGDDSQKPASGMPGESAAHHHCTVGLTASGPNICPVDGTRRGVFGPATSALLVSHAQAPPTQPPSA